MKSNIIIIGFMGVGKTSVGKRLADLFKMEFIDTDKEIERITGMSVSQIFTRFGEVRFRSEENLVVSKVAQKTNSVISTGGGAVIELENVKALQEKGILICLGATPEVIQARVGKRGGRPLLQKDKSMERILSLLEERADFYGQADYTVDTTNLTLEETLKKVLDYLRTKGYDHGNSAG